MRLPRIGVTCHTALITEETGHKAEIDAEFAQVGEVLSRCGAVPVLIPSGISNDAVNEYLRFLDGIILPSGPRVDKLGNDTVEPLKGGPDSRKDMLEWRICGLALSCGIPLLAICRGVQLLNVYLGGTIYDDVKSECPSSVAHSPLPGEQEAVHKIKISPASKLAIIFQGLEGQVNSYHHQAIKSLAPALKGTAWSEDGIIEGVESVIYRSLLGVQFCPEVDYLRNEASIGVFRWIVDEARRLIGSREQGIGSRE